MISYLLKSFGCLALFLIFYHFVLEREKMHNFNRFYLLGSVFFSFLIPQYVIYTEVIPVNNFLYDYSLIAETKGEAIITPEQNNFDFYALAITIYFLITSLFLFRFSQNIYRIVRKIRENEVVHFCNAKLVLVKDQISPHTFWNYIFINKDEYLNNTIEKELYTHELTHATQNHTLDIILIELLHSICWFNPAFIYLKKAIRLNHEFLADASVIEIHDNTIIYQELLLRKSSDKKEYYLASNLNFILTKKRLLMMTKQKSSKAILLKKLFIVPLLCGLLFSFAERVETYENSIENEPITTGEKDLFLASVERDGDEVKLKCYNCYRWAKLKIPANKEYIITDFGFTNINAMSDSEYAFSVKVTGNTVAFNGLKNVPLKNLELKLQDGQKHFINQNGKIVYDEEKVRSHLKQELKKLENSSFNIINSNKAEIDTFKTKLQSKKNQEVFYIKNKKGTTYYNNKGQLVNKHGRLLSDKEKAKSTNPNAIVKKGDITNIPPPPKPIKVQQQKAPNYKTGFLGKGKNMLYYVTNKKGTKYYNRFGQHVDKNGKILNPTRTTSDAVISNQYISKVYKDDKVIVEFLDKDTPKGPIVKKGDITNIPPPPKPIKVQQQKAPNYKTGFLGKGKNMLYYVTNKKGTKYYNRFGQHVDKNGKILNPTRTKPDAVIPDQYISKVYKDDKVVVEFLDKDTPKGPIVKKGDITNIPPPLPPKPTKKDKQEEKVTIDKISNLSTKEILELPKNKDYVYSYYVNNKPIKEEEFLKIKSSQIKSMHVVNKGKNKKAIYVITR